jgi:SMC interacting uncharacterized protein involved in chromosome segregation
VDLVVNLLPGTDKEQVQKELEPEFKDKNVFMVDLRNDSENLQVLDEKCQLLSESREPIKEAERFSAIKTLESRKKELEITENNLKSILVQLRALDQKIQGKQDQLHKNFTDFDLVVLEQDLAELVSGLNNFFKNYSFWKLPFKSDYLAQDLQLVLRDYSLMNGELQVIKYSKI